MIPISLLLYILRASTIHQSGVTQINGSSRFESGDLSHFVANDCCFNSIGIINGLGGAIYIKESQSVFSVHFTAFYKCYALEGGAIYCICRQMDILFIYGQSCYSTSNAGGTNFVTSQEASLVISLNGTSLFQCSPDSNEKGSSSICLHNNQTLVRALNCSANYICDSGTGFLNFGYSMPSSMTESLIVLTSLKERSSVAAFDSIFPFSISGSSFINNTLPKNGSGFLRISGGQLKCHNCVFSNNSEANIFYCLGEGSASVLNCFFSQSESLGNLSFSSGVVITMASAIQIDASFFDECKNLTPSASASTEKRNQTSTIVYYAMAFLAVLLGISIFAFYRLYHKNQADNRRLHSFELTESIAKEFG